MATAVIAESRCDPRSDTVEALDAQFVACMRSVAPLRRALARIAGEFLRRRTWQALGFARPADYARERPGLSARELHDLAHVDEALARLPAIDAALATGQLGWTKARLLCRVATPEDETHWLAGAGRLSAASLAREVRAIDWARSKRAVDPRELDARLCRAATLEQSLLARMGPLLLAFADARGAMALGYRSLASYARERLGMSPRKVRALLRVERACARCAPLAAAWRSGCVTWSQAQALVALVLAPGSELFHTAWIAHAAGLTVRRLEDDVDHALASGAFDPALLPELPEGVQIGARPMLAEPNDTWVANVPRRRGAAPRHASIGCSNGMAGAVRCRGARALPG